MTLALNDLAVVAYDRRGQVTALGKYVKPANDDKGGLVLDARGNLIAAKIVPPLNHDAALFGREARGKLLAYKFDSPCPCFGSRIKITTSGFSVCNLDCFLSYPNYAKYISDDFGGGNGTWEFDLIPEDPPVYGRKRCSAGGLIGYMYGQLYSDAGCTTPYGPLGKSAVFLSMSVVTYTDYPNDVWVAGGMGETGFLSALYFNGGIKLAKDDCGSATLYNDPYAACEPDDHGHGGFWNVGGVMTITAP